MSPSPPAIQAHHWLLVGLITLLIAVFAIKKLGQIPKARALEMLGSGALVLDVRSPGEFSSGHLEGAVNIPLDQVRNMIREIEDDRTRPLLVYCLSGTRSSIACRILRNLGYSNTHNLGSLARARSISGGG